MCDNCYKQVIGELPTEQLETRLKETEEKDKRVAELIVANKVIAFQNEEKADRAAELIIANKELAFQNGEKDKRAAELLIANKELAFQNEEKDKRAAELIIANKELAFQNAEKDKRAAELLIANKELAFQTEEKAERAAELIIANEELTFQTEEKEKRAAEYVLQRELVHIDRLNLIGNMAAGLAHEIRNPMTVVKGYLQFFKKRIPNSLHDQLDLVLSELARIETIITEFLEIAKTKPTDLREQDLNKIIDSIAPFLLTEALQRAMTLEFKLTRDIPKLMLAEKEIKQLMLNLAMNGLSAMEKHGTLTIGTKYQAGAVLLSIKDSGCGIAKDLQMKIFDPFFTTKDEGTGLGLSVCASIVAGHNAKIKVHSEEGKGACFIITFRVLCTHMIF